jgi:hypothetical protein
MDNDECRIMIIWDPLEPQMDSSPHASSQKHPDEESMSLAEIFGPEERLQSLNVISIPTPFDVVCTDDLRNPYLPFIWEDISHFTRLGLRAFGNLFNLLIQGTSSTGMSFMSNSVSSPYLTEPHDLTYERSPMVDIRPPSIPLPPRELKAGELKVLPTKAPKSTIEFLRRCKEPWLMSHPPSTRNRSMVMFNGTDYTFYDRTDYRERDLTKSSQLPMTCREVILPVFPQSPTSFLHLSEVTEPPPSLLSGRALEYPLRLPTDPFPSSPYNGMQYVKGTRSVYDAWTEKKE